MSHKKLNNITTENTKEYYGNFYTNSNVHCYTYDRHFYCYIIEFLLVFSSAHEETKLKGIQLLSYFGFEWSGTRLYSLFSFWLTTIRFLKGKVDNSVQLRSDAYVNIVPRLYLP